MSKKVLAGFTWLISQGAYALPAMHECRLSSHSEVLFVLDGDRAVFGTDDPHAPERVFEPLTIHQGPCCGRPTTYQAPGFYLKINWTLPPVGGTHAGYVKYTAADGGEKTQGVKCNTYAPL